MRKWWPLLVIRTDGGHRRKKQILESKGAFGVVVEGAFPGGDKYERFRIARLGAAVPVEDSFRAETAGALAGLQCAVQIFADATAQSFKLATAIPG